MLWEIVVYYMLRASLYHTIIAHFASQHVGVSSTTSTSILPGNQLITGPSSVFPKEGHSTYHILRTGQWSSTHRGAELIGHQTKIEVRRTLSHVL